MLKILGLILAGLLTGLSIHAEHAKPSAGKALCGDALSTPEQIMIRKFKTELEKVDAFLKDGKLSADDIKVIEKAVFVFHSAGMTNKEIVELLTPSVQAGIVLAHRESEGELGTDGQVVSPNRNNYSLSQKRRKLRYLMAVSLAAEVRRQLFEGHVVGNELGKGIWAGLAVKSAREGNPLGAMMAANVVNHLNKMDEQSKKSSSASYRGDPEGSFPMSIGPSHADLVIRKNFPGWYTKEERKALGIPEPYYFYKDFLSAMVNVARLTFQVGAAFSVGLFLAHHPELGDAATTAELFKMVIEGLQKDTPAILQWLVFATEVTVETIKNPPPPFPIYP